MKQNTQKNKTNQEVSWPNTPYFTIAELHNLNPKFINITLRVRLANAIETGKIVELGAQTGGKGRPQKVFAVTPITQTTLNKAKSENINLVDNADKLVTVASVSKPVSTTAQTSTPLVSVAK